MIAVIYARVSSNTGRQDTERQVKELTAYAKNNNIEITKVFEDYISGARPNKDRWVLQGCLKYCIADNSKVDCVLMYEVSRLGRDIWEMIELVKFFHDYHLNVYFMRENLWMYYQNGTENPLFSMLFAMFSKFAENERTAIKERLQSGYKNYRANGGKVGRKVGSKKTIEQLEEEYRKVLKELRRGTSIARTAKLCDTSTATVARLKKTFNINRQK
jgi:DNA invertase Pin-like site-specific DNA recombinase|nr:recombinase family protein [uncultured Prevotella sp.]